MKKNFMRFFLIFFSAFSFFHIAAGKQLLSLTLEKAVATGLDNSKLLHSSLMKVRYTDARSSESNTALLPTLKAGAAYARLSNVPPFEIGPFSPLTDKIVISPVVPDNYTLRLTLQQPVFTGFRLQSNAYIAEYTTQSAQKDYQKVKEDFVFNIKNSYWNLFKANELKKVIDENIEQIKAHLKDVQNFFNQGMVTKNEVLIVEVQLSNAEILQIDAANSARIAMIGLNSLIGLPLDTQLQTISDPFLQKKQYDDLNMLIQNALDIRPDIKSLEFRIRAAESAVKLAHSGWFPQIYLSGNYYYSRPNQRFFPTIDKFKDTWDIGISASMDIWNWGATIHQSDQSEAQLAQASDDLAQLQDIIKLEVTQNYLNLIQSKERIAVAEKGVNQSEENYRITREKFKSGLGLNSDLIDAEAAMLQAKFNNIQALVDHEIANARLQKSVGGETALN